MVPALPPERRRIYLMRHGAVTYFDETGYPLQPETVPLNATGREQASAAGRTFAAENIVFDRVIVSGLPRTVETAQRVLAEMPAMQTRGAVLEIWPELQEIRSGKLGEIPRHQITQAFIGAFAGAVPHTRRFLNGERIGAFLDRIIPAIARLRALPDWDTVLLVLHGGTNRAILSHALSGGKRVFFGTLAQAPGCINVLDVGGAHHDWVLRMSNFSPPSPTHVGPRLTMMETLLQQYLRYRDMLDAP